MSFTPDRKYVENSQDLGAKFRETTSDTQFNQVSFSDLETLAELLIKPIREGATQDPLRNLRKHAFGESYLFRSSQDEIPKAIRINQSYFGLLTKKNTPETTFPVFFQKATNQSKQTYLDYWVIPIPISALTPETRYEKNGAQAKSAEILAAAALAAPHMIFGFDQGMKDAACPTNPEQLSGSIEAAHIAPVALAFDYLKNRSSTQNAITSTQGKEPTLVQAGHLHGLTNNQQILSAARGSGIASGVAIARTTNRNKELGVHGLFLPGTQVDGNTAIFTLRQFLESKAELNPAMIAGTLAFASEVVGEEASVKQFEKVFTSSNADTPISQLFR
ncbi:MAG: hypothetical protein WDZ94_03610 [Patescibacteria group bacterium]